MTDESKVIHEEAVQVTVNECDFNLGLKPAAFFQHLIDAAAVHAEQLGAGYDAMVAKNLVWVLSRMKIRYFRFPRVGETITIRTWPKTIQRRLFYIRDFVVLDAGGERLAAATTAWLAINAATHRMAPPNSLNMNLPAQSEKVGLAETLERIGLAKDGEEWLRVRAGYSALDILGHVNNGRYVDWICDAFPLEMFKEGRLDWIQLNYEHEILPGEEVSVMANRVESDPKVWALEGLNRSNNTRAFEALLYWKA